MTENRRSKDAIRSRMARTGEKYTEARRALLTPDSEDGRPDAGMRRGTVADEYLAELGAHQDAWDSERAVADWAAIAAMSEELIDIDLLRSVAQPVIAVVIKLSVLGFPGADLDADAGWAAMLAVTRRDVLTLQRAGIDAGLADGNLGLIDIVESRIGFWPDREWRAAVRGKVQGWVDARDRGREHGQQVKSELAPSTRTNRGTHGWALRHPTDHYFRRARANMTDRALLAYLDQQIAAFAPSYATWAARDWSSEMSAAEFVGELQISEPVPIGWENPVPATVLAVRRGGVSVGSEIGIHLVADRNASFNGTLLSVLGGERWLVCGTMPDDDTVVPGDGTRRLLSL